MRRGTGLSRTVSYVLCLWRMRSVPDSGSEQTSLCITRLWHAASKKPRYRRQHVRQSRSCRDQTHAEAGWCKQRGRKQQGEIEAESGRDRVWHSPIWHASLEETFEKKYLFWKIRKAGKCLKKAQNQIFLKILKKIWRWNFSNSFVFVRFLDNFQRFIENFVIFQNSPTWCLAEPVSLGLLPMYCVSDECGLCLTRALHGPVTV
jgi:hypothetical protein